MGIDAPVCSVRLSAIPGGERLHVDAGVAAADRHMREGALAGADDSPRRGAGRVAGVTGVAAAAAFWPLVPGTSSASSPSIALPAT